MKKCLRSLSLIILTLILAMSLVGCGSEMDAIIESSTSAMAPAKGELGFSTDDSYIVEDSIMEENSPEVSNITNGVSQKLVYTAWLGIETKNYDDAVTNIRNAVSEMNGYIESTDSYSHGSKERTANFKIRVPVSSYQSFLSNICEMGNITHQSEYVEDVTSQYLDVEARLQSLSEKLERLRELQKEAVDIEQLLIIETQISETQYQIENYTSQMNYIKNRISYCTVNVEIEEVIAYTENTTFASEISETHKETIEGFVRFLKNLLLLGIEIYPYIICLGAIVAVILCIYKKRGKIIKIKLDKNIFKKKTKGE